MQKDGQLNEGLAKIKGGQRKKKMMMMTYRLVVCRAWWSRSATDGDLMSGHHLLRAPSGDAAATDGAAVTAAAVGDADDCRRATESEHYSTPVAVAGHHLKRLIEGDRGGHLSDHRSLGVAQR